MRRARFALCGHDLSIGTRLGDSKDGATGILLSNHSAVFRGGTTDCTAAIKGTGLFQGEVLAGLSMRF